MIHSIKSHFKFLSVVKELFAARGGKPAGGRRKVRIGLEALEDRAVPAALGPVVSGFVFNDANSNGQRDAGEAALAGVNMELRTPMGVMVGSATTDSTGQYRFDQDMSAGTSSKSIAQKLVFENLKGAWSGQSSINAFNPALGTLTQVDLKVNGKVTTSVKVENLDTDASTAKLALNNKLFVLGPSGTIEGLAGPNLYSATMAAFDGSVDFVGASGFNPGARTMDVITTSQVTAAQGLSAWTGTGMVNLRAAARGTSVQESNTNLMSSITTQGRLELEVVYNFIPSRMLQAGSYLVVEPVQPSGYLDGFESIGTTVLPGTIGTDSVGITLGLNGLSNVNFGEVKAASLRGTSYIDAMADGVLNAGDYGAEGAMVRLSGIADTGAVVSQELVVGYDGRFEFTDLRPGTYKVISTLLDKNVAGSTKAGNLGGTVSTLTVSGIKVKSGDAGVEYQFGQYVGAGLSGTVYADMNGNGWQDADEQGIAGQTVQLTGGASKSVITDEFGWFEFGDLKPGVYTVANPTSGSWLAQSARAGAAGGVVANTFEQIQQITLGSGTVGESYLFGKALKSSISGVVFLDANKNGVRDAGEVGVSGVTLRLAGNNDLGQIVSMTTVSALGGHYSFNPLRSGSYSVTQVTPNGYTSSSAKTGNLGGSVLSSTTMTVSLNTNQDGVNYDFALIQNAVALPLSKRMFLAGVRR